MDIKKTCFVAIVGLPNVGKSSLINSLVEFPVSIVSLKSQTTRDAINAIYNKDNLQILFVDTPGFHMRINNLSNSLNYAINSTLEGIDLVLFLHPVDKPVDQNTRFLAKKIAKNMNKIVLITKTDLENDKLNFKIQEKNFRELNFEKILPFSTNSEDLRINLLLEIEKFAYPSDHFYSNLDVTDQSSRFFAKEIIRKQILLNLEDEIPHQSAVLIDNFDESDNRFVKIEATIYVGKKSHLPIIIGKGGSVLGKIGTDARRELEGIFGKKVVLKNRVSIAKKWFNNPKMIKRFGY
ncbi:GTPase Era [Mesomycoplasma hyopneumoniae]|uniref:GTPase Era n=1 Tax=Mesomycoplasma hyopneumoniae TaxID=2099 RepID=A0A223M9R8_MESHO|nr:GTPase Era [Mesomycoplasma hyopneumoniae]ASU14310.1 GTPase Era [Mesomycoplasma hyopneumoniae]MXR10379.1 GTPase Era [Mesomycoplasma hyopneumoniae]MXR10893.1 GTPase Era [Mesomycoplasma hyopneumoniae]MXR63939.1 GTPase Era [Mesomycoplasma hyopneumoniae]QEA02363.1 GTPase Era [Mesomycoplasma hyopneumoniae]